MPLTSVTPTILGRFNPLHIGHKYEVILPILKKCPRFDAPKPHPYILMILGSSSEDRDLKKNPLSFIQRRETCLITIEELLQNNLAHAVSEENLARLSEPNGIRKIIDISASFVKYVDDPKKNTPPSLTPLKDTILNHCQTYGIPIGGLTFFSSVRTEELGRAYQIDGQIYENMAQLTAVANHLGAQFSENHPSADVQLVSATKLRNDFAHTFDNVSPKVFQFLQRELALSVLNHRPVGVDKSGDTVKDAVGFVAELAKDKRMLAFDNEAAKVVAVPEERRELFSYYRGVAELNGKAKPGLSPEPSSIGERVKTLGGRQ